MQTKAQVNCPHGEDYAQQFADKLAGTIWPAFCRLFRFQFLAWSRHKSWCMMSFKVRGPSQRTTEGTHSECRVALCCLVHPWSLLALLLLAFNDHWLKGMGPPWLTGKLSDVAGLFYFPFLVIIFAALLPRSRSSRAKLPVGRFVFWAIGIWFAAAKSIPIIHAATVRFAELLLGEVQVIRDPSDALAVIALLPAWLLYRHTASRSALPYSKVFQPAVVGIAVLLTAATSKPRTPSVNRLVVHEDQLYAVVEDGYDHGGGQVFSTIDGITWEIADLAPSVLKGQPRTTIESGNVIMRLEGRKIIASDETASWSISDDRQQFMKVAGADPWWHTMDIAALPQSPGTIVVALGPEGIVVRTATGAWRRHGIGLAQPTPERTHLEGAVKLVLRGQWMFGAAATVIAWLLISLLTWCNATPSPLPVARSRATRSTLLLKSRRTVTAALRALGRLRFNGRHISRWGILLPFLLFAMHFLAEHLRPLFLPILVLAIPFLALSALLIAGGWERFNKAGERRERRTHFSTALLAGLTSIGMLMLWDLGWIESVTTALLLATCSVIGLVLWRAARIGSGSV